MYLCEREPGRDRNDLQHGMRWVRRHAKVVRLLPGPNSSIGGVVNGVLLGKAETLAFRPIVFLRGQTVAVLGQGVMRRGVQTIVSHRYPRYRKHVISPLIVGRAPTAWIGCGRE